MKTQYLTSSASVRTVVLVGEPKGEISSQELQYKIVINNSNIIAGFTKKVINHVKNELENSFNDKPEAPTNLKSTN